MSKYQTKLSNTDDCRFCVPLLLCTEIEIMAEYEDPSKKRRLDEDGTSSAFADSPANTRKEKLESWLKPLNNEQLFKLLLDMCVGVALLWERSADAAAQLLGPCLLCLPLSVLFVCQALCVLSCPVLRCVGLRCVVFRCLRLNSPLTWRSVMSCVLPSVWG